MTTQESRSRAAYRFGPFVLDARSRVLWRDGVAVPLAPRTFDLLYCFVTSGGRLLTKTELLGAVWGDVNVEEGSVAFQVSLLRKALGEPGLAWIETVPKHGYRFIAAVEDDELVAPRTPVIEAGAEPMPLASGSAASAPVPYWRSSALWGWAAFCVVAVVLAAVAGLGDASAPPAATPVDVVPLTSFPGVEQHPSLSPDGTQVAFSWERDERAADIYVMFVGQGSAVALSDHPGRDVSPAWSPDGRLVAFCRETPVRAEVIVVPAQGGSERSLALAAGWTPDCGGGQVLSWFPRSDALAVAATRTAEGGVEAAIHRVPLEGAPSVPLTAPGRAIWGDALPAVSPDGRHLAFTRSESGPWVAAEIRVLPLTRAGRAAGQAVRLVSDEPGARPYLERVTGLAWSPSTGQLLFSRAGIWSVSLTGDRQPTRRPVEGHQPTLFSVARNGGSLAFADGTLDVDLFELAGPLRPAPAAQAAPIEGVPVLVSTFTDTNPQFSGDGRRIAFTSTRSGSLQIWTADANGDNAVQVTQATGAVGTPRWSPDGRYIAYDTVVERGRGDIMVIPAGGGPARRLTPPESHEQVPSWSRDGAWIYFESNRGGSMALWKVRFPSGPLVQVTEEGGAAALESPDARWVYYGKRGAAGLWRRPVAGGPETRVVDRGHAMFWGMHDTGACWMDPTTAEVHIECLDFASGRVSTVARLKGDGRYRATGPGFAVSPDGSRILYARVAHQRSDLMLARGGAARW